MQNKGSLVSILNTEEKGWPGLRGKAKARVEWNRGERVQSLSPDNRLICGLYLPLDGRSLWSTEKDLLCCVPGLLLAATATSSFAKSIPCVCFLSPFLCELKEGRWVGSPCWVTCGWKSRIERKGEKNVGLGYTEEKSQEGQNQSGYCWNVSVTVLVSRFFLQVYSKRKCTYAFVN